MGDGSRSIFLSTDGKDTDKTSKELRAFLTSYFKVHLLPISSNFTIALRISLKKEQRSPSALRHIFCFLLPHLHQFLLLHSHSCLQNHLFQSIQNSGVLLLKFFSGFFLQRNSGTKSDCFSKIFFSHFIGKQLGKYFFFDKLKNTDTSKIQISPMVKFTFRICYL